MAGRERAGKTDQRGYWEDIWGNPLAPAPAGNPRRKKNQPTLLNGVLSEQQPLFSGAELQVPFPDRPVNPVPDQLGATPTPNTLFTKPEEERAETQQALFTPPSTERPAESRPSAILKPREETPAYIPLSLPKFHLLVLDDRREIHYVPAIMTSFDATWNVAELRPLYAASSTDREHALSMLRQAQGISPDGEVAPVNNIQVFVRPEEETRVKTAQLSYVECITKAQQGEKTVYLSGELQPSRTDPEVIALVGYSAVITPDYTLVYDLIQRHLRKNALEEEQVTQEDRPTIRRFLQAMRGGEVSKEANAEPVQAPRAARRQRSTRTRPV